MNDRGARRAVSTSQASGLLSVHFDGLRINYAASRRLLKFMLMRTMFLCFILLATAVVSHGQETTTYVRDSIYGDRGITGTLNFEPETRTYFPRRDEQGRTLEEVIEIVDNTGNWRPQSRKLFAYQDGELTEMHIQVWVPSREEWVDQRRDHYTYQDGLLQEFRREKAPQGTLRNDRLWSYTYNEDGAETEVLLQEWNGADWEDLSRKVVSYTEDGNLELQTLQVRQNNDWRNVRCRQWAYETQGNRSRVRATTVKVWSPDKGDWVDQLRKLFFYNDDGLWERSRFENWNEETQQWENSDRMLHLYNDRNQPVGQYLQRWNGEWENRGRVSYSLQDNQFFSRIETWDEVMQAWTNFLRYRATFDDNGLLQMRTGMQAWNEEQMAWENRGFTQRFTHYWSELMTSSAAEIRDLTACLVPNPYRVGTHFFCDLPPARNAYQLELYDVLGRPVYRRDVESGQAMSIDRRPAPGMYVLRIHDGRQLYHVQRLVIR